MRQILILLVTLIVNAYAAPQFITFKDGKLGVNFGGYHAGVGLGGLLGGGAGGGLYAEAGTPHGQSARAGLGGAVDGNGRSAGGLYAGATAGGDVKAEAGLGGSVAADRSSGGGFASASAGGHHAASGLGGATSGSAESSGGSISIHKEINIDAANEIKPSASFGVEAEAGASLDTNSKAPPAVIVKEVYVQPPPTKVVEKHIIRTHKPHGHHRKTAYIGGFIEGGADIAPSEHVTVVKTVEPIQRRVDVGVESQANAGAESSVGAHGDIGGGVTYKKRVSVASNPTFFEDIFNIPISTLKAVNSFLTNAASGTSIQVEKSASVHAGASASGGAAAESDFISPKHASSSSAAKSSEAQISVQTPSVSELIDGVFSIPINTLSAVNKFLENNVAARKRAQASEEEAGGPTRVRLGPAARRRAHKHAVIIQESDDSKNKDSE